MKREEFKQVIKLMSFYRVDKRKGNYQLLNGETLKDYLLNFTKMFLEKNNLAIAKNENIYDVVSNQIFIPFSNGEKLEEQEERIEKLINELLY